MSYDLQFCLPREQAPPSRAEVQEYFRARPHYRFERSQIFYEHPDTGTYFVFFQPEPDQPGEVRPMGLMHGAPIWVPEDEASSTRWAGLSFNLNFLRPATFAREAAVEIHSLVKRFGFLVFDPQAEEPGDRPFDPSGLVDRWSRGNAMAYASKAQELHLAGQGLEALEPHLVPSVDLMRCWTWNFHRAGLERRLDIPVPKVVLVRLEGGLKLAANWPDAGPIALPRVDIVFLLRDRIAPRRLLFFRARSAALAGWEDVAPLLGPEEAQEQGRLPFHRARAPGSPEVIREVLRHPPMDELPQIVDHSHALQREVMEKCFEILRSRQPEPG